MKKPVSGFRPQNLVRARFGLERPMKEWTNGLDIRVQRVLDGYVPDPLAKICRLEGLIGAW